MRTGSIGIPMDLSYLKGLRAKTQQEVRQYVASDRINSYNLEKEGQFRKNIKILSGGRGLLDKPIEDRITLIKAGLPDLIGKAENIYSIF